MKWLAAVAAVLGALIVAGTAEAQFLSYSAGYRAVVLDSIEAKQNVEGADDYGIGVGRRASAARIDFPVSLEGDELVRLIPGYSTPDGSYEPHRSIYEHFYCTWTSSVHWRGRSIVVNRRRVDCEEWEDESPTQ